MDMLQEDLINNNFDLIATELFNDDPKIQVENLKVRFPEKKSRVTQLRLIHEKFSLNMY